MIPGLMYQLAQDRRAELLREAEEYRRARPTVLMRVRARIPRFPLSRRSRAGVVGPSTPGLVKGNILKGRPPAGEATIETVRLTGSRTSDRRTVHR
jgi:hypothetical protein